MGALLGWSGEWNGASVDTIRTIMNQLKIITTMTITNEEATNRGEQAQGQKAKRSEAKKLEAEAPNIADFGRQYG